MKALFLTFTCFSEKTGVGQKIQSQINAIKSLGFTSVFYGRYVDTEEFTIDGKSFGKAPRLRQQKATRAFYDRIYDYIVQSGVSFIYYRFNACSNLEVIHLFKKLKKAGIKQVIELPTYPYDGESENPWDKFVIIDKLTRRRLMKQFDYVVTFSSKSIIFGQRTISISNGVDFDRIPKVSRKEHEGINLLGVANLTSWHGYDRVIDGIEEYYKHNPVIAVKFHIVCGNDTPYIVELKKSVESRGLTENVIFHGEVNGTDLDDLFNSCDLAIGSLGRHRNGITHLKTLKNVEYAARGVPFVYSEINEDFEDMPYVAKISQDDTPLNIQSLIDFLDSLKVTPDKIRESVEHLSWKKQFETIKSIIFDA